MSGKCPPGGSAAARAGATLIEMIMALFLGGMVLLGLGWVYGLASGLWMQSEAKMRMHANGTLALRQMADTAGLADRMELGSGSELRLSMPASPLDPQSLSAVRVFRRKEEALWMDGKAIVPGLGDSGIGVAEFLPEEWTDPATGVRVLSLMLKLYSRSAPGRPSDSMQFQTTVHLRNRMSGASMTGSLGETSF